MTPVDAGEAPRCDLTSAPPSPCLQEWGEAGAEPEAAAPKDKVQVLRDQVDGVKKVMTDNVERILARGERLDDLMDKTSELQDGVSVRRRRRTTRRTRQSCHQIRLFEGITEFGTISNRQGVYLLEP